MSGSERDDAGGSIVMAARRQAVREPDSVRWILISVLGLFAVLLLPPILIGAIAERDLNRMVARTSDAPIQASLVSYQRGLFRADAVVELRHGDSPPIVVKLDIRHGPLLPKSNCGGPLGLAVAAGEILPAAENTELVRLFGQQPLPILCAFSSLDGDGVAEIQIPSHPATTLAATGDEREYAWGPMSLKFYEVDVGLRVVLNIPHFEIAQLFQAANLRNGQPMYGQWDHVFQGVTLNQTITTERGHAQAVSELRIATINATRTVFEPEAFAELQGLDVTSETEELDGILDWRGRVAWDAIIFPSWHASAGEVPMQLLNIDALALRDINLARSANRRSAAAARLLAMGPVLRIGPASQHVAAGGVSLDVAVLMHPGPVTPETAPAELLQRLEARFDFSLPVGLLYGIVRDRYEDDAAHEAVARNLRATSFQISRMAEAQFDSDLARIATRGLWRRDGERLLVDLTLIEGLISSDAQTEPLLDLIEWLGLLLRTQTREIET